MRYIAPAIISTHEAMTAVRGLLDKIGHPTDSDQPSAVASYEADE